MAAPDKAATALLEDSTVDKPTRLHEYSQLLQIFSHGKLISLTTALPASWPPSCPDRAPTVTGNLGCALRASG
jgi:hypothetical protein